MTNTLFEDGGLKAILRTVFDLSKEKHI